MTPEQIEKWRKQADAYATKQFTFDWHSARDTEFARLATADIARERDAAREALRELVRIDDTGMGVIGWDAAIDRARAILEAKP